MFKYIDWSYPTSTNAERFGFSDIGCWTILVGPRAEFQAAVSGYATIEEAQAAAEALPHDWHPNPIFSQHRPVTPFAWAKQ